MRVAFIGQKGIPATFGGVEFHVEELATRLAARGHQVTVYVRNWYTARDLSIFHGVRLVHTPTVKTKHLDAAAHSFTSSLHAVAGGFDVVHYHAIGPAAFSWLPRLAGRRVVVTIHRFDYDAAKWGALARRFLKASERMALTVPQRTLVVARHQKEHYAAQGYGRVVYIPNGVNVPEVAPPRLITEKYGLKGGDYLLSLGRLTPEKRVDWLLDAFRALAPDGKRLVVAGGSSATDDYVHGLHRLAGGDPAVVFTGYVTGQLKEELFSNAAAFVIPSALEGLPIALLEAMSYGLPCLASDIPPHREVITPGVNGYLFAADSREDLARQLRHILNAPGEELRAVGASAREHVRVEYDWDKVVDQVEAVYRELVGIPMY